MPFISIDASAQPPHLRLPPLDRELSSFTGWTRDHWLAVADQLLDALVPWATADGAQYRLPGRNSWSGVVLDGLEGFARPFLLAATRLAAPAAPPAEPLIERYTRGLLAGTNPRGAHAWPTLTDCSQQVVEAASIALGLHLGRDTVWAALDDREREQVTEWLAGVVGKRTWDNNWILFRTIIEQFLASVGAAHSVREIEEGLDRIEDWYAGDGWYTDGDGRKFDYYNAFILHTYPLFWTTMVQDDGGRRDVYRERLRTFLGQHSLLFGRDGAPVLHGRSLTYRFGILAPFWLGQQFDATPLRPGQTRRLTSSVIRYFAEHGAPDRAGLLPLGWHGTHLPITQPYSGPASPYWASMAFFGLTIDPDDPVWTDRELALSQDDQDLRVALPTPGWLVHSTHDDGVVRLINHGSDHNAPTERADDPCYAAFAYSNHTSPDLGPLPRIGNHVAVLDELGHSTRRSHIVRLGMTDDMAASRYEAELPDGTVASIDVASVLWGRHELRLALVRGAAGLVVQLGGYPLSADGPGDQCADGVRASATTAAGLTSAVLGLHGWTDASLRTSIDSGAFGPWAVVPQLGARADDQSVFVALVTLSGEPAPAAVPVGVDVTTTHDGARVELDLAGEEQVCVVLGGRSSQSGRLRRVRTFEGKKG